MRQAIAQQLASRPWYTSGSTLQVSRLAFRHCVLVGDAAHAVSAAFGQGVNAALEVRHSDPMLLASLHEASKPSESVPVDFIVWLPRTLAISTCSWR